MNVTRNGAKPQPSRGVSKRRRGKEAKTVAARSAKAKRGTSDGGTKRISTSSFSATKGSRFDGVPGSIELLCEPRTAQSPQTKGNNIANDIVGRTPNQGDTKRTGQPWQLEPKMATEVVVVVVVVVVVAVVMVFYSKRIIIVRWADLSDFFRSFSSENCVFLFHVQ